ncbi:MAG: hypothetical protein M3Y87_28390, partial [Myxococcota bacterium]|nr:hypothetical protein [Myxococcota bacterium]
CRMRVDLVVGAAFTCFSFVMLSGIAAAVFAVLRWQRRKLLAQAAALGVATISLARDREAVGWAARMISMFLSPPDHRAGARTRFDSAWSERVLGARDARSGVEVALLMNTALHVVTGFMFGTMFVIGVIGIIVNVALRR